jgi:hypothetical protein
MGNEGSTYDSSLCHHQGTDQVIDTEAASIYIDKAGEINDSFL